MGERAIDRVQVGLSRETVTISWDARQALLERLRRVESLRSVVDAFEAVGVSRPVALSPEEKDALSEAIRVWAEEAGGYADLPEGIEQLRLALVDEPELP
jgi:hypothetical protein